MARTVSFEATLSPWLGIEADISHTEDMTIQSSSYYEYIYGITPAIAAMIHETRRLGVFVAQFERQQQPIPDDLLQACEVFGDTLLSWSLANERILSIVTSDDLMMTLFNHQARAWQYAALIYYYRLIQRYKPMDFRKEVQYIIDHLDAAEDVKSRQLDIVQRIWEKVDANRNELGPPC